MKNGNWTVGCTQQVQPWLCVLCFSCTIHGDGILVARPLTPISCDAITVLIGSISTKRGTNIQHVWHFCIPVLIEIIQEYIFTNTMPTHIQEYKKNAVKVFYINKFIVTFFIHTMSLAGPLTSSKRYHAWLLCKQ